MPKEKRLIQKEDIMPLDTYTIQRKELRKEIVILHPGPINRGVEITSEVADSEQAIILDQVENGVAVRMAIIYLLASKLNIPTND